MNLLNEWPYIYWEWSYIYLCGQLCGGTYIGSGHTYICVAIHMYNRLDIDNVKSVF